MRISKPLYMALPVWLAFRSGVLRHSAYNLARHQGKCAHHLQTTPVVHRRDKLAARALPRNHLRMYGINILCRAP